MTSPFSGRMLLPIIAGLALPLSAAAQSQGGGRPPEPNFAELSQALGVKEASVERCMPKPERGQRPERPDPNSIAECLNANGSSVSAGQVGEVLKKFGPKRP